VKIQILAHDGKLLETIEEVHIHLKSQGGMGSLMDKILEVFIKINIQNTCMSNIN